MPVSFQGGSHSDLLLTGCRAVVEVPGFALTVGPGLPPRRHADLGPEISDTGGVWRDMGDGFVAAMTSGAWQHPRHLPCRGCCCQKRRLSENAPFVLFVTGCRVLPADEAGLAALPGWPVRLRPAHKKGARGFPPARPNRHAAVLMPVSADLAGCRRRYNRPSWCQKTHVPHRRSARTACRRRHSSWGWTGRPRAGGPATGSCRS